MDVVSGFANDILEDQLISYGWEAPAWIAKETLAREAAIYFTITLVGGYIMYFLAAGLAFLYFFIIAKETWLPDYKMDYKEVQNEIRCAVWAIPWLAVLTTPLWFSDSRHTYKSVDEYGWTYLIFSVFLFIFFTDFCIYWIHRWLHHRWFYGPLHKLHHSFVAVTPFASHAFHPVDAWLQAMPYHIFPLLFPLNNWLQLALFVGVNFWTVSIHDRVRLSGQPIVNGAHHHKIHHTHFVYNYGQYTTIWDRIGGTYLEPGKETTRHIPKQFRGKAE